MPRPELVVALDFQTGAEALDMARALSSLAAPGQPGLWMKVGLELFVAEGPSVLRELKRMGFKVFLDLKFLDIPNTVRGAVRSAVKSGADMLNIHAAGGLDMAGIAAAARDEAFAELGGVGARPLLLAVTVLTSMQDVDNPILRGRPASEVALELARQSREAGLDGVVCSGQEAARVKQACGPDFVCLTPGIRVPDPDDAVPGDDQRRVMTPEAAVAAGADFLVVGRPITRAPRDKGGPAAAARGILERMARAAASAGR
ncbi:orotidine-5'-phosphate decarboxylase [Humidesulfovibrio mexicanus]|uniref:Orotidine 5'-phosphate decarboxylase n=1 Tax=Humidesulfovibrio mexicanus TaxID=147047 RepID=A0A238ZA56_9BACT|nr:orotidine-5'-phosphate decarboxylase [Humidesulfovibrio mexicanus]SNR79811.1 orotidine-5'-phosphate decarboxylase [Humidesulfovibrio mexicanus]